MDNCLNTFIKLLKLLKVKHTVAFAKSTVLSHADYPSMLAISDALDKYKVENLAIQVNKQQLGELPLPCIVQVKKPSALEQGSSLFYTVMKVTPENVSCFNEKNHYEVIDRSEFCSLWSGVVLLAEKNEYSIEPGIAPKYRERNASYVLTVLLLAGIVLWVVNASQESSPMFFTFIYILLKLVGLGIGALLLWYEVDSYQPVLQKFCSGGKKMNCVAVINSQYARLLGKGISLSSLSFSYFFAGVSLILITSFSMPVFHFLGILSIVTIPVIAYSVYLQAMAIKKWCRFCLMVLGVLVLEIAVIFLGRFHNLDWHYLPIFGVLFIVPLLSWKLLRPLIIEKKFMLVYKRSFNKIKSNPVVLEGLLRKSRKITTPVKGLGILLKNENPKYYVIKVCNPYCGPCAQAHPVLEQLYKNGTIDLHVIFTAQADPIDKKAAPVCHLMAIAEKGNTMTTRKALDNWYQAEKKDYEAFAHAHPMNGELEQQWDKLEAMSAWCKAEKITATPTIFINGYELPEEYRVEDLSDALK